VVAVLLIHQTNLALQTIQQNTLWYDEIFTFCLF